MNAPKIESKREIYYLKYKKSSIFDDSFPQKSERNEDYKITDKVTNRRYDKIFIPNLDNLTSRQRYIQNLYKNDFVDLINTPKKKHSKIKRIKYRSNSESYSKNKTALTENNFYKKRNKSFYRANSNNDEKSLTILRTTTDHRIRSIYSRYSDIFNTDNNFANSNNKHNKASILSNKEKNIEKYNISDNSKTKIKPKKLEVNKNKNVKNCLEKEFKMKNNIIKSEREKEELLRKKVREKQYNKKNNIKIENNNNELLPPMYKFRLKIKNENKKTNINNLESVNYNIINNKKSNIRQEYTNLSAIKPSFEKISNYEIKIPKDFNKVNEVQLKNILNSEGLHYFHFSEEGDIISGRKGKYIFKIRNTNNEKDYKKKIKRVNSKFKKLNVKLNKVNRNYSKKKSELFHDIPTVTKSSKNKIKKTK